MKKLILIAIAAAFPLLAYAQEAPIKQIRRAAHEHVYNDATRLAALLRDVESNVNYSDAVWKAIGNESNGLANRIYTGTAGNNAVHNAAKELRSRVRQMRDAATKGDPAGARSFAGTAMPFAYAVIDWASEKP
jgi:hypothetical protein